MKRNLWFFAVIGLAVVGCGGGGSTSTGGAGNSPFAGKWSGQFEAIPRVNGNGPVTFDIEGNGSVKITGHNNATHSDFAGTGTVTTGGLLTGTVKAGTVTASIDGTVHIQAGPRLTGLLTMTGGGRTDQLNIDLAKL